jgi:hypothetical protein
MVIAVRTEEAEGGLVVVKEARSDGDVARLTREAAYLARSRHPGVVELVDVGERAITLRHAGTALARLGPFPADQVAGIVCAVADVVQALHRLDVVHGDLDAPTSSSTSAAGPACAASGWPRTSPPRALRTTSPGSAVCWHRCSELAPTSPGPALPAGSADDPRSARPGASSRPSPRRPRRTSASSDPAPASWPRPSTPPFLIARSPSPAIPVEPTAWPSPRSPPTSTPPPT